MAYQCRVERDSISPEGRRLTSFVIQFPRVVLAETVTHRLSSDTWGECEASWCERTTTPDVSKNSASSRAIPFARMLERVNEDPYIPAWTLNQKGMQGKHLTDDGAVKEADKAWLLARDKMVESAQALHDLGIHKQDCNRLLESWAWVTQIVTSSCWDNFFALRCHEAAHPAFRKIARMMYLARKQSRPRNLIHGQWHLPFLPPEEEVGFFWPWDLSCKHKTLPDIIKYSAARCAWISYENHDKEGTPEAMLRTFDRLLAGVPVHASPVEHQATPISPTDEVCWPGARSNLAGWLQARKLLAYEQILEYAPSEEEVASWGM